MTPLKFLALSSYLVVAAVCTSAEFDSANNASPPAPPLPPLAPPSYYNGGATATRTGPKPKDYPYAPANSRVDNLVGFYEAMRQNLYDPEVRAKQNVLISLSEAASKLYLLSYGYSLDVKCNKYVKLIEKPNIRSFVTVRELMNEPRHFSEIEQSDANLLPHLVGEREFDALSKLQTILQTLESERIGGRSSFEPNVQKDLLHCMNYYIYRHQRATTGLVEYIRDATDKLNLRKADDLISEAKLKKFNELMENIKQIEEVEREQSQQQTGKWLDEFSKLYELALENHFELPKLVEEFANDPARTKRLNSCGQATIRANELLAELQEIESSAGYNQAELNKNIEYRNSLLELYALYVEHEESLPREIGQFLNRSDRLEMIEIILSEKTGHSPDSEEKALNSAIEQAIENIPQKDDPVQPEEHVEQPSAKVQPESELEVAPAKEELGEIKGAKTDDPEEVEIERAGQQQAEQEEIEDEVPKFDSETDSDSGDDYQPVASDRSEVPVTSSESGESTASEPVSPGVVTRLRALRRVETCSQLANELQGDVRSFNPTELDAEQVRILAQRVNSFDSNGCMEKNAEYCANSCRSSQWASLSMTKKLLDWTASQMQNAHSLPSSQQAALSETLALLQLQSTVAVP